MRKPPLHKTLMRCTYVCRCASAVITGLLSGLTMFGLTGCGRLTSSPATAAASSKGPPPISVQFEEPIERGVTPTEEFGGRAAAKELVELRSRVSGYLKKVNFVDGADVQAGDLLFEIEDETYRADFEEAEATVKQRVAEVGRLKTQLDRARRLTQAQASTEQEVERLTFETQAAEAAQKSAEAARDRLALDVQFTKVLAPIGGKIGRRLVDPGNLIQADLTPLATIVSQDPVYAYFDYDERSVLAMRRTAEKHPGLEIPSREQPIQITLAGETKPSLVGHLNWIDNQIDMGTGTLRARAAVDNKSGLVTPGMFVRLRVPLGPEETSVLVPQEALVSDQGNRYVYVLKGDSAVEYRKVTLGPIVNVDVEVLVKKAHSSESRPTQGAAPSEPEIVKEARTLPWQVVRDGLSLNERVVVTGLQRIKGDSKVTAKKKVYEDVENSVSAKPVAEPKPSTPVPSNLPAGSAPPRS